LKLNTRSFKLRTCGVNIACHYCYVSESTVRLNIASVNLNEIVKSRNF
jgi:DNA repair photolyase